MPQHFVYQNLPAGGLGIRDPLRPSVTGGLGRAIFLLIITDFFTGDPQLKWVLIDPDTGWEAILAVAGWKVEVKELGWQTGEPETMVDS